MGNVLKFIQENFTFFLIGLFIVYLIWDYTKTHNVLKLLFIIPIALSLILVTPLVSYMTKEVFFVYRIVLILSCFAISFVYFSNTRKRRAQMEAEKRLAEKNAQKKASQQSRANSPYKGKKKK